jgi:Domain of unknown function (DUF4352)
VWVATLVLAAVGAAVIVGRDEDPTRASRGASDAERALDIPRAPETTARSSTTTTTPAPSTRPPQFSVGDKVTYDDGASVQVFSYEQPAALPEFVEPSPGTEFALIDVEVCAGSNAEAGYNPLGFALQTPDNRQYPSSYGSSREPPLASGTIRPGGGCVRGWVTIEAPSGARPAFVVWNYPGFEIAKWAVL